jgi:hypothetical protein
VCKKFGRGSLGAILWLISGEVSSQQWRRRWWGEVLGGSSLDGFPLDAELRVVA